MESLPMFYTPIVSRAMRMFEALRLASSVSMILIRLQRRQLLSAAWRRAESDAKAGGKVFSNTLKPSWVDFPY